MEQAWPGALLIAVPRLDQTDGQPRPPQTTRQTNDEKFSWFLSWSFGHWLRRVKCGTERKESLPIVRAAPRAVSREQSKEDRFDLAGLRRSIVSLVRLSRLRSGNAARRAARDRYQALRRGRREDRTCCQAFGGLLHAV